MMKRFTYVFLVSIFLIQTVLTAAPTSLIPNNLLMSSGTIINDGLSPLLIEAAVKDIPYTEFLDFLVQNMISVDQAGTLNIVLKPGRALKTGPWQGGAFVGNTSHYFPGVSGLPSNIVNGDSSPSDNEKNAYSHLQIGRSALGSSLWFLMQNNTVRIDAYKNLNQSLEPANPIPLGLNLYKDSSNKAGNAYIGTGFFGPSDYPNKNYPPVMVVHNSLTSAQVGFGGVSTPNLSGSGAHVKGNLNVSGQVFGKIGAVLAFNRVNLGVLMEGESTTSVYDYESFGGREVSANEHALTLPLRLNSTKALTNVEQPGYIKDNGNDTDYVFTVWPFTNNLEWNSNDYDFKNETSATLNGFILTEAVCNIDPSSRELLHMSTIIEKVDDNNYPNNNTYFRSPWTIFEYGEASADQTFVNLSEFTASPGKKYRFYVQFLKWKNRPGDPTKYSGYPLTVSGTKFIMYVLPATMELY